MLFFFWLSCIISRHFHNTFIETSSDCKQIQSNAIGDEALLVASINAVSWDEKPLLYSFQQFSDYVYDLSTWPEILNIYPDCNILSKLQALIGIYNLCANHEEFIQKLYVTFENNFLFQIEMYAGSYYILQRFKFEIFPIIGKASLGLKLVVDPLRFFISIITRGQRSKIGNVQKIITESIMLFYCHIKTTH